MELIGSNARFGVERRDLTNRRYVLPTDAEGRPFPAGVGGLLPVVTEKKGGRERVIYAFPTPVAQQPAVEGSAGELPDQPAEPEQPDQPAIPDRSSEPAVVPTPALDALAGAVDLVNALLDEATRESGHGFGYVDGIQVEVPMRGRGFTHVEIVPRDEQGEPNPAPVRLHVETSKEPSSPDSLSATIDYDEQGTPRRALLTEYGERGYVCRAICSRRASMDRLVVRRVEESLRGREGSARTLFGNDWSEYESQSYRWSGEQL